MSEALFYLDPESSLSLQNQIRQKLVQCIMAGTFPAGARLPSSRKLAEQLGVARNTVVLSYEQLIGEGLLESRERSGLFVARDVGWIWIAANCLIGITWAAVAGLVACLAVVLYPARVQDGLRR